MSIRDKIIESLDSMRDPEATEADIDSAYETIIEIIDSIEGRVSDILDEIQEAEISADRLYNEL